MTNKSIQGLKEIQRHKQGKTLMHSLGIEFTTIEEGRVCGTMPVDERSHQYFGMLHGGASVAFAETLCSCGAATLIDVEKQNVVGLEINANHVKAISSGLVYGEAKPIHVGKTTQVWSIEIRNEKKELVCISRCTIAVIDKKK